MSYFELSDVEKSDMENVRIVDKIAYALNCLTECTNHKISYCAAAMGIKPGELIRFE